MGEYSTESELRLSQGREELLRGSRRMEGIRVSYLKEFPPLQLYWGLEWIEVNGTRMAL